MCYQDTVIHTVDQYKRKKPSDKLILVPILNEDQKTIGFLHPVTADYRETIPGCVELFSRWRVENPTISTARFAVTHERTEKWLDNLLISNNNRFIFLIQELSGEYIGHIGFANFRYDHRIAEVDSVLRGKKEGNPGIMQYAMQSLIHWGKETLGLEHIDLEVLSDNDHAISFYQRCGFYHDGQIPLEKVETPDEVKWVPCEDRSKEAEKYYLHMTFC